MRTTLALLTLALLTAAPLAFAQEEPATDKNETRPDDAAWVEDCPPDMMCAADAGDEPSGDEPTRGPADGSCENCRGDEEPVLYGNDGCIDCSGPINSHSNATCMDGADPGEACDPDVQYLGGPQPETTADETTRNAVPAPAVAAAILALAGAAALVLPRRR